MHEAATINLVTRLGLRLSGDTVNVTGFENVFAGGSSAAVSLTGNAGDNKLYGGAGADTINGGAGDDRLHGNGGADSIDGGAGNDTIAFDGSSASIAGGAGSDTLFVYMDTAATITIDLSSADQTSSDTANVTGFENVLAYVGVGW